MTTAKTDLRYAVVSDIHANLEGLEAVRRLGLVVRRAGELEPVLPARVRVLGRLGDDPLPRRGVAQGGDLLLER